jgi:hypothetical protein
LKEENMLWTIAVTCIIFWLLGMVTGFTMGDFIHIAPAIAIIVMLFQFEEECGHFGSRRTRVRPWKRRVDGGSGKRLPDLPIRSGEKVPQPIGSLQTCRKGQPL